MTNPDGIAGRMTAAAAKHASRIALESADREWTYAEAEATARRWATALAAAGCRIGQPVVVHLPSGPEFVIAVRALTNLGAGCVPVDPGYPDERKRLLAELAGARYCITSESVEMQDPMSILTIDELNAGAGRPPTVAGHEQMITWISGTSGSTGRPKAVALTDRGLVQLAEAIVDRCRLTSTDRIAAMAAVGFSVAAEEVLSTWCSGATLVFPPAHCRSDPWRMADYLDRLRISFVQFTPSYWNELVNAMTVDGCLRRPCNLSRVVIGSDDLPISPVVRWLEAGGTVYHEYGVTEGSVSQLMSSYTSSADLDGLKKVPIGRPLAGSVVHLLDERLEPCPPGRAGEIHVGGPGLALGYLAESGLTADRFLPDPISEVPGTRMYKTGDRAVLREDGSFVFIGRSDHQLNVGGVRIEPAEIEAALVACPEVTAAGVGAGSVASGGGIDVLTAVVQWRSDVACYRHRTALVLDRLRHQLPSTHLPGRFVDVEHLPTNLHGKLDRRRLADLIGRPHSVVGRSASTDLELGLREIWCDALGYGDLGVDVSMDQLGVDSMSRMRLAGALARSGYPVAVTDLHPGQSIETLADELDERNDVPQSADTALPAASDGPVSLAQGDLLVRLRRIGFLSRANEALILGVDGTDSAVDPEQLALATAAVIQSQACFASRFTVDGSGVRQWHDVDLSNQSIPVRIAATAAEMTERVEQRRRSPFDLERGPLWEAAVWLIGPEQPQDRVDIAVSLVTSHLIFDGSSMDMFGRELDREYRSTNGGDPLSTFARRRATPAGIAERERSNLAAVEPRLRNHWFDRLSAVQSASANLPEWMSRRPLHRDCDVARRFLPSSSTAVWDAMARGCGGSPGTVALALLSLHLGALGSGEGPALLGYLVDGRDGSAGSTETMGFLTRTLIVAPESAPGADLGSFVDHVQARLRESERYSGFPVSSIADLLLSKPAGRDRAGTLALLGAASVGWHNVPSEFELAGKRGRVSVLPADLSFHLIHLEVDPVGGDLVLRLTVDAALADAVGAADLLDRFVAVAVDAAPSSPVTDLLTAFAKDG